MGQRIQLRLFGEGLKERVPVSVIAEKLKALQNLVFHAAATVAHDRRGRSGAWANRYRGVAELSFASAHHSDLVIEAELPDLRAEQALGDLGRNAIDLVFTTARVASDGGDLQLVISDREERLFLIKALEDLCPATAQDYKVELGNGEQRHPRVILSADTRRRLRERVTYEIARVYGEEETIVGMLTKVHVHTAPQLIAVRIGQQEDTLCYFGDPMRDMISNLLPGSIVEVTGVPVRDMEGRLLRFDAISDVDTVSMEPLRLARFEHEGVLYKLKEPLIVSVEYVDGVWIYHNDSINLWGYARRRVDAIRDLHATFDYLWHEFAEEDDSVLDEKALQIKRRLLEIVEQSFTAG